MTDLRDFLNWFDGFAENIDKTPNAKQWAKIKERVAGLRDASVTTLSAPEKAAPIKAAPVPPKPRPEAAYKFMIDENGVVMRTKDRKRVLPADITSEVYDKRGGQGDLRTIVWADDAVGLNGADIVIVGA